MALGDGPTHRKLRDEWGTELLCSGWNTEILRFCQNDLKLLRQLFRFLRHLGRAFELVPVEGLAVDGALDGLEEYD